MASTTTEKSQKSSAGQTGAPSQAPITGQSPPRQRKRKAVESMMAAPWKPENVGDCLEGTFHGMEKVPGKGKRDSFKSYHIEQPDGTRVRVASAMLNTKLNQVPKGTYVWLTYKGLFQTSNGNSPDYDVEVEEGTDLFDPLQESGSVDEARV